MIRRETSRFLGFAGPSTDPLLLVPKQEVWTRQPSGRAIIRAGHLSRGLRVAAYPGSGEDERCPVVSGGGSWGISRAWNFAATAGRIVVCNESRSTIGDTGVRGQGLTVFVLVNFASLSGTQVPFAQRISGSSIVSWSLTLSSSSTYWNEGGASAPLLGTAATFFDVNKWCGIAVVDSGDASGGVYYNNPNSFGSPVTYAAKTLNQTGNDVPYRVTIGAAANDTSYSAIYPMNGKIALALMWARSLKRWEIESVFRNPWQMFA